MQNPAVEKMNVYANDLVKMMVKDGDKFKEDQLKVAFENLARAMVDMTNIHLEREKDVGETLKISLSRMKIAHNCVYSFHQSHISRNKKTHELS